MQRVPTDSQFRSFPINSARRRFVRGGLASLAALSFPRAAPAAAGFFAQLVKELLLAATRRTVEELIEQFVPRNRKQDRWQEGFEAGYRAGQRVYSPPYLIAGAPYFVAPLRRLGMSDGDGAQFWSPGQMGTGILSGPSAVALGLGVRDLAAVSGYDRQTVAALLVPCWQDAFAAGRFSQSYPFPERYRTADGGGVQIHYAYDPREDRGYARFQLFARNNLAFPAFERDYPIPVTV